MAFLRIIIFAITISLAYSLDCAQLGFTENLLCPNCDRLHEFVANDVLANECRNCCHTIPQKNEVYKAATLKACYQLLTRYPHVHEFISKYADQFRNLNIQFTGPRIPSLLLFDEANNNADTLNLESWRTEDIIRFLKDKLVQ